jgi:hypothetical protein
VFEELIGREHAAGVLRAQIERAVASHGGLVLVTGEAGIGKTALVTGAAEEARRLGALVLSGACWDSQSAPGYWPWVQVVRALRRASDAEAWAAAREAAGGALDALLGESGGGDRGGTGVSAGTAVNGGRSVDGDPAGGGESFELHDAVTTLLATASQDQPVVVVLEDLHWADAASLRLLRFTAQHAWFERLLLIGTYRETEGEVEVEAPLAAKATTVGLTGLAPSGVATLIARTTGREPDAGLAAEVHRRTGGNPFFVEQTARLWQSRGHGPGDALTAIPPGVRDTVRHRLSLLPRPVAELLTGAAVLGREFHRALLATASGTPVAEADRLLDQAVAARLVTPLGAGRFAFAHDLVRETLYETLDERARRHAAVVRALDRQPALVERCGVLPAELARHARLAGGELPPARTFELLRAAADEATNRMAYEEAIGHLRRAYELAGDTAIDPTQRVMTGLMLGEALHHNGDGSEAEAWPLYQEIVAEVRALDDPEMLARVGLSLYQIGMWLVERVGPGHRELTVELLREANARLGGASQPPPDASLNELARQVTVRSVVLARRGADDDALGFSLSARHDAIWGLGTAAEREAILDEMIAVARRTEDRNLEHFGMSLRWVALLELGDPRYLEQLREFVAVVDSLGIPRFDFSSAIDQCIVATLHGDFARAEQLYGQATESGTLEDHEHFASFGIHLRWAMLLAQGRFEEIDELLASPATRRVYRHPELIAGITAAQRGDVATAIRLHADIAARRSQPPRSVGPLWLRLQAQAAAASRDPVLCERARAALAPYAEAGIWSVSMWGFDVSGPMVLWAAEVDAAEERWDAAVAGFTEAAPAWPGR